MLNLYTRQQAQQLDQRAIEQHGISGFSLMQTAGGFALDVIQTYWPKANQLAIVCGSGNNGGDGYALAKHAKQAGLTPKIYQVGKPPMIGDAAKTRLEAGALGVLPQTLSIEALNQADLIIDGLFGIGLNRPVEAPFAEAIDLINQANKPVLALDTPSGLDTNTGQILGSAVKADITTSFIVHKIGLFQNYGPDFSGKVLLSTLDIPSEILNSLPPVATSWQTKDTPERHRIKNTHKGSYGQALLIGGNQSMLGAIALAGKACLRAGSGLVKIISREEHLIPLTQMQPELMCFAAKDFTAIKANAIGIGPGLGQDNWAWQLYEATCQLDLPMVLDADALNCLALEPFHYERWVLTPHPAEAARLLEKSTQAIQQDRIAAIQALHKRYGGVIVLKGTGTLIYDGHQLALCHAGNPGMATGGMGDVLTGIITSLIAQGLDLFNAARLGVEWHARAADRCIETQSEASLLPSDVIEQLKKF